MHYKVLIVEDEPRMREIISDYFQSKEIEIEEAADGAEALDKIAGHTFDVILLDIMIPALDGFSVCRRIRQTSDVPIIFLTARSDEDDKLFGYELGADDYITKPFSLAVLYAKTVSLIKRYKGNTLHTHELVFPDMRIDLKNRQVSIYGENIYLPPKEYDLLLCLVQNRDQILSREQLLSKVWGHDFFGYDRVVDSHIKKLRAALGEKSCLIRTIIKAGYKFDPNA